MRQFEWRKEVSAKAWPLLLEADPSTKMIKSYINQSQLLEVHQAGELIGLLVLKQCNEQTVEIMNLSVRSDFQQQGIGKELIQRAIAKSRDNHYRKMIIATGTTSTGPFLLYQKCGFRVEAIERDYFIKYYTNELVENGIVLRDRLILSQEI